MSENKINNDDNIEPGKLLAVVSVTVILIFSIIYSLCGGYHLIEKLQQYINNKDTNTESIKRVANQLRMVASEVNLSAPQEIADGFYLTSLSVSDEAVVTSHVTMRNISSSDIDEKPLTDSLRMLFTGFMCKDKIMKEGFDAGAQLHFVVTTVDGLDVDAGLINKDSCK